MSGCPGRSTCTRTAASRTAPRSPAELVAAGRRRRTRRASRITDHDSTAGWDAAFVAAEGTGLTVVPGMELSTQLDYASVHLLGVPVRPRRIRRSSRRPRASATSACTAPSRWSQRIAADYDLDWDDVLAQTTPGATVGRPHIADALVARGHVPDRTRGVPEHPALARRLLPAARGAAAARGRASSSSPPGECRCIAHPGARGPERAINDAADARELVDAGLFGLEIDHRDNSPQLARALDSESRRSYGLVTTGSSDYHGAGKPNRLGENTTSPEVYAAIVARGDRVEALRGLARRVDGLRGGRRRRRRSAARGRGDAGAACGGAAVPSWCSAPLPSWVAVPRLAPSAGAAFDVRRACASRVRDDERSPTSRPSAPPRCSRGGRVLDGAVPRRRP